MLRIWVLQGRNNMTDQQVPATPVETPVVETNVPKQTEAKTEDTK